LGGNCKTGVEGKRLRTYYLITAALVVISMVIQVASLTTGIYRFKNGAEGELSILDGGISILGQKWRFGFEVFSRVVGGIALIGITLSLILLVEGLASLRTGRGDPVDIISYALTSSLILLFSGSLIYGFGYLLAKAMPGMIVVRNITTSAGLLVYPKPIMTPGLSYWMIRLYLPMLFPFIATVSSVASYILLLRRIDLCQDRAIES